jgi:hypothetical protein
VAWAHLFLEQCVTIICFHQSIHTFADFANFRVQDTIEVCNYDQFSLNDTHFFRISVYNSHSSGKLYTLLSFHGSDPAVKGLKCVFPARDQRFLHTLQSLPFSEPATHCSYFPRIPILATIPFLISVSNCSRFPQISILATILQFSSIPGASSGSAKNRSFFGFCT